jgi:hypothetical protein
MMVGFCTGPVPMPYPTVIVQEEQCELQRNGGWSDPQEL